MPLCIHVILYEHAKLGHHPAIWVQFGALHSGDSGPGPGRQCLAGQWGCAKIWTENGCACPAATTATRPDKTRPDPVRGQNSPPVCGAYHTTAFADFVGYVQGLCCRRCSGKSRVSGSEMETCGGLCFRYLMEGGMFLVFSEIV